MVSRRWLVPVLLLSLGVNVGVLAALGAGYLAERGGEDPSAAAAAGDPDPPPGFEEGPGSLPTDRVEVNDDDPRERFRRASGPFHRRLDLLADRLDLEGEPRERFLDLQKEFLHTTWTERRRTLGLQHELRRQLAAPEPDLERVEILVDDLAAARSSLDRSLARTVLESRALLAAESPGAEAEYLAFLGRLRPGPRGDRVFSDGDATSQRRHRGRPQADGGGAAPGPPR